MRGLFAKALAWSGAIAWARRSLLREHAAIVLMFHRVLPEGEFAVCNSPSGMVMKEQTFRDLLLYLKSKCETLHARDLRQSGKPDRLRFVLTFDDGWKDTYAVAFPNAKKLDTGFDVFVCPGLTNQVSPFWPERLCGLLRVLRPELSESEIAAVLERLKQEPAEIRSKELNALEERARSQGIMPAPSQTESTMSWVEIREMAEAGFCFGSHSDTHPILPQILSNDVIRELRSSKSALEAQLGRTCDQFAYPNGGWSPSVRDAVQECGFEIAFTTEPGAWTSGCDQLTIPRMNISEDNVTGFDGTFSRKIFEYLIVWKAWRTEVARKRLSSKSQSHISLQTSLEGSRSSR